MERAPAFQAWDWPLIDSLLRRLVREPLLELLLRHHLEVCPHVVVPQPAELGADDLLLDRLRRGEMNGNHQAGDEILLHPQVGDVEGVPHVLGVQGEQHLAG